MASGTRNATAPATMASPLEEPASAARPGAALAASASGPPNDATANAVNAQGWRGGASSRRATRPLDALSTAMVRALGPATRRGARRAAGQARRRARGSRGDRGAGRRDQPPLGAEAVASLARGAARGLIRDEVVQRVALVGHLFGAVGPRRRPEIGRVDARSGHGLALCPHRGPRLGAGARAVGLVAGVRDPQVDGTARGPRQVSLTVCLGGADRDTGGRGGRRGGRRRRSG